MTSPRIAPLLRPQPAPQPDPGDTLTKYLLALNATLVELRADMDRIAATQHKQPTYDMLIAQVKANGDTRLAVYAEIVRIVAEDTKPASEPKSNNTPVGYPVSDSIVEHPEAVDDAMAKFRKDAENYAAALREAEGKTYNEDPTRLFRP